MIVDCHTHIWQSPDQLGLLDLGDAPRLQRPKTARTSGAGTRILYRTIPAADPDHHYVSTSAADKSFVLGFKSRYLRAEIPNRFVSDYIKRDPQRLIGFAGIDPTESNAPKEVKLAREELCLRGLTLSPGDQDFHPSDTRAMRVYALAEELSMPVLFHPVGQLTEQSKLEYSRPFLLDEVARTFPRLRIVVAQMGQPWIDETICLLGKHPHVFADVSGLLARPWQAYNALVSAYQYGVIDKLLFGSDFPYTSVTECIEKLYSLNQIAQGTNLPMVPRESLRGIVERDSLTLLGLT
ncbi:MAG: amidohydrolase family protein [Phycisphaerae bacterium]|nr:amidohydrolase family protein [Phycisphaerae bacterium]MDW8262807.1 amidohydrolase family protein [Phycisphaerales bacterium]